MWRSTSGISRRFLHAKTPSKIRKNSTNAPSDPKDPKQNLQKVNPLHPASPLQPRQQQGKDMSSPSAGIAAALILSLPIGTALYLKQNPSWNPSFLQDFAYWQRFRALLLSDSAQDQRADINNRGNQTQYIPKADRNHNNTERNSKESIRDAIEAAEKNKEALVSENDMPNEKDKIDIEDKAVIEACESELEVIEDTSKADLLVESDEVKKNALLEGNLTEPSETLPKTFAEIEDSKTSTDTESSDIDDVEDAASPTKLLEAASQHIEAIKNNLFSEMKTEMNAIDDDIENTLLKDIETMDAKALSIRVAQLAMEMKHRTKWEVVRFLEALKRMEKETEIKCTEIIEHQHEMHKLLLLRELEAQKATLSKRYKEQLQALEQKYSKELHEKLEKQRAELLKNLQHTFERETKAIEARYQEQLKQKSEEAHTLLTAERSERLAELEKIRAELRALNFILEESSTYEAYSHQVHKTSMAAMALSERLEAAAPLTAQVQQLLRVAQGDEFIQTIVRTLPDQIVKNGAPSVKQLQDRFSRVKKAGCRAAMIPEGSGLAGQIFATTLSYLLLPPGGFIEGNEPDAIFSRAEYALKAGNLENAIKELQGLQGLPASVCKDWMEAARTRIALEQTIKIIKAHIALLAESCA